MQNHKQQASHATLQPTNPAPKTIHHTPRPPLLPCIIVLAAAALFFGPLDPGACDDDGAFGPTGDAEDEKRFNAEVDELATRLREIWRKINDAGLKLTRTEAKGVLDWVQQRLSYSVRTRRKVKKSVFDIPDTGQDPFLPRQQDYMKNFLKKPQPAPSAVEDTITVKGG